MKIIFFRNLASKLCSFAFLMLFFSPANASALAPIDNEALDNITGQSGITLAVSNVEVFTNIDRLSYIASDNGFIEFYDFRITDGANGPARYNFGTGAAGVIYMDLGAVEVSTTEDWDLSTSPESIYKGMLGVNVPEWDQQVAYFIPDFVFSDGTVGGEKHLGSILIGAIDLPNYNYFSAPHGSGVDWEYGFEMHIDHMAYKYNEALTGALCFEDIHIGRSFDYGLAGDNPADPGTWKTDIGQFTIGDMFGNTDPLNLEHSNPARFDVGVINDDLGNPQGAIGLQLPLSGSVRLENVDFGGVDFGPGAIDGITAHRLELYLIP